MICRGAGLIRHGGKRFTYDEDHRVVWRDAGVPHGAHLAVLIRKERTVSKRTDFWHNRHRGNPIQLLYRVVDEIMEQLGMDPTQLEAALKRWVEKSERGEFIQHPRVVRSSNA